MIREDVLREAEELAVINRVLELQWQRQVAPELAAEWVTSHSSMRQMNRSIPKWIAGRH